MRDQIIRLMGKYVMDAHIDRVTAATAPKLKDQRHARAQASVCERVAWDLWHVLGESASGYPAPSAQPQRQSDESQTDYEVRVGYLPKVWWRDGNG